MATCCRAVASKQRQAITMMPKINSRCNRGGRRPIKAPSGCQGPQLRGEVKFGAAFVMSYLSPGNAAAETQLRGWEDMRKRTGEGVGGVDWKEKTEGGKIDPNHCV